MPTKPKIHRGRESGSPEKDTEILVLTPRGAAGAKPLQCTKCDKGTQSAHVLHGLFSKVNTLENKWWVRLVPAAAVTPAPRVATIIIGPKASVAGFVNAL